MPTTRKSAVKQPRIKNYTTDMTAVSIMAAIRKVLVAHKAKRLTFDYDEQGREMAIQFGLEINGEIFTFRLPARFALVEPQVAEAHAAMGRPIRDKEKLADQAYRTAWRIILDWVEAQMAIIDAGVVKTEEVFFPYLVQGGQTLFERFEEQRLLPSPNRSFTIREE